MVRRDNPPLGLIHSRSRLTRDIDNDKVQYCNVSPHWSWDEYVNSESDHFSTLGNRTTSGAGELLL